MIADIWTIVWKEYKELLLASGNARSGLVRLLLLPAVWGIFLPLQSGRDWIARPESLISWAWVPALLVVSIVADSFAGERERHTLETLLASRMPDRSILFGKVAACVGYGWGLSLLTVVLGLVTVNLAHGHGQLLLYPPAIAAAVVGISLLEALLTAGVGVLISLRASTVRQAQQTLSFGFLGIALLVFAPFLLYRMLPLAQRAAVAAALNGSSPTLIGGVAIAVVALITLGVLAAAMGRFQRSRLILD